MFGHSSVMIKSALSVFALISSVASRTCNGHEEFCDRLYSNVSVIAAHNSYAVSAGSIAANQNYTVERQLNDGIRALTIQLHASGDEVRLCHSSCLLLDAGTLQDYLSTVKTWLDANTDEVVTLIIVNNDQISPATLARSYSGSGIAPYAFTPSSTPISYNNWPTLGGLIDSNTRLVSFLAQGADMSSVPYLLDQFTHVWETPFSPTDPTFPCTVDRVTGSAEGKMYMINHNLNVDQIILGTPQPVPAVQLIDEVNALSGPSSLTANAQNCYALHGYLPTFTLVDFYDTPEGNVFRYAASLNGVEYVAPASTEVRADSTATTTGTSSSGKVSSKPLEGGASSLYISTAFVILGLTLSVVL